MRDGVIGLADCLGFKGIWRRASVDTVLGHLELSRVEATNFITNILVKEVSEYGLRVELAFLSDTIVATAFFDTTKPITPPEKGFLILMVGGVLQRVATRLIAGNPAISVRGCIHSGQFMMKDTFIIGPAVDAAANMYEAANGAFIWLAPNNARYLNAFNEHLAQLVQRWPHDIVRACIVNLVLAEGKPELAENVRIFLERLSKEANEDAYSKLRPLISKLLSKIFIDYDVPFKGGSSLRCPVINPALGHRLIEPEHVPSRYNEAMLSDELDVMIKRDNTLRFVNCALKQVLELQEDFRRTFNELIG